MSFEAKVVQDSLGHLGKRLMTFQTRSPRMLHAEVMTHRAASKNASSSRAIPAWKFIKWVKEDPAMFVHVGKEQKGMQAREEVSDEIKEKFHREWLELRDISITFVERWYKEYGIHKQVCNRALEPWHHISLVMTLTDEAFLAIMALRRHPDADPGFQALADVLWKAREESVPRVLKPGEWHLPYLHPQEIQMGDVFSCIVRSAARCCRVSYNNMDGMPPTFEQDQDTFEKLAFSTPEHMSPFEHQATMTVNNFEHLGGNLGPDWIQFRKLMERVSHIPQTVRMQHLARYVNNLWTLRA